MLLVLVVGFAVGHICDVHHCRDTGNNAVRRQTDHMQNGFMVTAK